MDRGTSKLAADVEMIRVVGSQRIIASALKWTIGSEGSNRGVGKVESDPYHDTKELGES